jgi:hypothetical protein
MAIYKIFPSADASIYSLYPTQNTGLDEILEVSVKNSSSPTNYLIEGVASTVTNDDLRRCLVRFSDSDLATLRTHATGSWKSFFRMSLANAENLTQAYTLEFRQVSQSWAMGTGQFGDNPETRNGVCWYNTQSYFSSTTNWINPSYYLTSGGGSWTNNYSTQSFDTSDSKDVNVDVTTIVDTWFSGSKANNGLLIKHTTEVENSSGSYMLLNFFSNDTHTIYPPSLDIRWDDSSYISGSLALVSNSDTVITLANNIGVYKWNDSVYKFRINARDKYPARVFTTSSLYTSNKRLPITSYWALQDVKTNETIIDFDTSYTKISCDGTNSYFYLYANGLEPERYYKILIKTILDSGETLDIDNNLIFKIIK